MSTRDEDMRNFGSNEFWVDVMILRITIAHEHQHFLTPFSADFPEPINRLFLPNLEYPAHSTDASYVVPDKL